MAEEYRGAERLSALLREYMEKRQMTQVQLAKLAEVTQQAVSLLVTGQERAPDGEIRPYFGLKARTKGDTPTLTKVVVALRIPRHLVKSALGEDHMDWAHERLRRRGNKGWGLSGTTSNPRWSEQPIYLGERVHAGGYR